MAPRPRTAQIGQLPRPRLDEQLKMSHPLVRLFKLMNWDEPDLPSCIYGQSNATYLIATNARIYLVDSCFNT